MYFYNFFTDISKIYVRSYIIFNIQNKLKMSYTFKLHKLA